MKNDLKQYQIHFLGLSEGEHEYRYAIGQEFFDRFGYDDNWSDARIQARAVLIKRPTVMELSLSFEGTVLAPCDVTGEEFRLPVEGEQHLVVKQGDTPFEDDDVVVLSREEGSIDIAQYLYETIVLNIPQKRYHPDYVSGKLKAPAQLSPEQTPEKRQGPAETDPRWEKLKDINVKS